MRALTVLLLCALPATSFALTQPNGATIPSQLGCRNNQPSGLAATFACACTQPGVCNIGAACPSQTSCDNGQHGTCETTLFHSYNDNTCIPSNFSGLNPWSEAAVTPETFRPTCPLTFTVLTRGTALFRNVFGWYNVTGSRPAQSDLHVMMDCSAAAGAQVVLDVVNSPAYRGGDVGFFIATPESHTQHGSCADGDCCATLARIGAGKGYLYFSQRAFNDDSTGANPFIHLVIYASHLTPRKFYFSWEDLYGAASNDFSDFVTGVQGIECAGGGGACDTGQQGVCANGVRRCQQGALTCAPLFTPQAEICDGLDNDCDGVVDNDAPCPQFQLCQGGRCVPHCKLDPRYQCPDGLVCDEPRGFCVEQGCVGRTCPAHQTCRAGACVAPCEGVVCPHGTLCRNGACLDPCAGVTCPNGEACAQGVCLPGCNQCNGILCEPGLACDGTTGRCRDPACPPSCPAGQTCRTGACRDACEGALCPSGQRCELGACVAAGVDGGIADAGAPASDGGAADAGIADAGPDRDAGLNPDAGILGDAGLTGDAGSTRIDGGRGADGGLAAPAGGGCDCSTTASQGPPWLLLASVLAGLAWRRGRGARRAWPRRG